MCGIVCTLQDITSSLFDLKPPFWGHHYHCIIHCVHCICVITPTLLMISPPLYVWYHFQYMGENLSTIFLTSYTLCMTTKPCVLITPHSAYVWHHFCYRSCHVHSIKPRHNLYEFTSASGMKSHHLYQKSQQLYLCHHSLSTDITPTFYYITPNIFVTSFALYITSYPLLISSNYSTYDSRNLTYETTSSIQFKIYTTPVTSQSLICVITPTVLRASQPLFVWHHTRHRYSIFCTIEDIISSLYEIKPSFLLHHTHYILHCIDVISVTTSTVLIPHQLYIWDLILCMWLHHCIQHIHYICTIVATVPVSPTQHSVISHPLYIWHCTHYMFNIRYST